MSSEEERGSGKIALANEKTAFEQQRPGIQLYNDVEVVDDNGILSKLRRLKAILVYERYAWFIFFIILMIFFGETGKYAGKTTPSSSTGVELTGSVLSLLAIIYRSSRS